MLTCSQQLAAFAAKLKYEDIPPHVRARARDCIIDGVGAVMLGARLPWSAMIIGHARRYGGSGPCSIIGAPGPGIQAPYAALANGVLAHAYELDSVSDPSVGAHPGATLLPAVLAACEENQADGRTAITAFVAACEVMFRIGLATHYRLEALGFHQPAYTGCFGATVASARVHGLDAARTAQAIGIAGSLGSGVLACTRASQGVMVKRLHLGRAAESGVLAARLAAMGYDGPETVLEGRFGFLDAYCRGGSEAALLTAGLGTIWETMRICMKRYPCHKNAHVPIQAMRELVAEHRFDAADVEKIVIARVEEPGSHHNLSNHGIAAPADVMQAQHSVPFCVALSLFRNPEDPRSFDADVVKDPQILAACRKVELGVINDPGLSQRTTRVTVHLKGGRRHSRDCELFKGMPANPFTRDELRDKFMLLAGGDDEAAAARLFETLEALDQQPVFTLASR